MTNPLMTPWNTPFGLPPFAMIKDEDFAAAFDAALASARENIAAIAGCSDAPSFANTIEAMELAEGDARPCGGGVLQPCRGRQHPRA